MTIQRILLISGVLLLAACESKVEISYEQTEPNGIVTYVVENPTDEDIAVLVLGFNYLDDNGALIKTDTVTYAMAEQMEDRIFLKANEQTWVNQRPPEGAKETEAFVIRYE